MFLSTKKNNEIISRILLVFILIQPILDFYIFFENSKNNLSSVALPTVIRFVFMAGLSMWAWFNAGSVTKKKMLAVLGVILAYSLTHWLFAGVLYKGPGSFSWIGELFYLARLTLPLIMLYVSTQVDLDKRHFEVLVFALIFLISGVIVSLNLMGKSLGSYTHQLTNTSIFDWSFDPNQNGFLKSATKGLFMYANQVSSLLVFLMPLALNFYFKKPSLIKFLAVFMTVLAGLMLGTRIAAIGLIAVVFLSLIAYFVFHKNRAKKMTWGLLSLIIGWMMLFGMSPAIMRQHADGDVVYGGSSQLTGRKTVLAQVTNLFSAFLNWLGNLGDILFRRGFGVLFVIFFLGLAPVSYILLKRRIKKSWPVIGLLSILTGWLLLFGMSPVIMRQYANNEVKNPQSDHIKQVLKNLDDVEKTNNRDLLVEFIGDNYKFMSISQETITVNYSYKEDPIFWSMIFREPLECRINNRCIQDKIAVRISNKDVAQQGAGVMLISKLFGTGYTRADSLFPIEKDFLSHYRNLGLVGMIIFTAAYVVILGLAMINFVCSKKDQRLETSLVAMSVAMLVAAAYMSGNTLDSLFVMLIACFVMGQYIRDFKNNLQWAKIKLYLNRTQVSQDSTIESVKRSLDEKNKSQSLIITANPETFEKALLDTQFNELMTDKNTIITPDGIGVVVAARMSGHEVKERVSGVELTRKLLEVANQKRLKVSSLGATSEVASDFEKYLKNNYPNLKIGKVIDGYSKNQQADIQAIVKSSSQIALFALGSGEQEKVASRYLDQTKNGVAIGVGGTLDVLTGRVKRAPEWAIKMNLEWLYRVAKQPKRIIRLFRYNGKFLLRIMALYTIKIMTLSEE